MQLSLAKLLAKGFKALKVIFDEKDKGPYASITCSGWLSNTGEFINNANTGCFGGLSGNPFKDKIVAVVSCLMNVQKAWVDNPHYRVCNAEQTSQYIDWLITRSPYKDAFLSKKIKTVMKNNMVAADPSQPANLMVSALVATRYLWESYYIVKGWVELVNAGVNETLAYLIMHCASFNPDNTAIVKFLRIGHSHHAISSDISMDMAKNFLSHTLVQPRKPYNENPMYYGFDGLWSKDYRLDNVYSQPKPEKTLVAFLNNLAKEQGYKAGGATFGSSDMNYAIPYKEFPEFILKNEALIIEAIQNA